MFAVLALPLLVVAAILPLNTHHLATASAFASASAGSASASAGSSSGSSASSQAFAGNAIAPNSIIQRTIAQVNLVNGQTRQRYDTRFGEIANYLGLLVRTTPVTADIERIIDESRQLSTQYLADIRAAQAEEAAWATRVSRQSVRAFASQLPADNQQNQLVQHYLKRMRTGAAKNAQVLSAVLDAVEADILSTQEQNYEQALLLKSQALQDYGNEAAYQEALIEQFDGARNVIHGADAKYWALKAALALNLGQQWNSWEVACNC